MKYSIMLQNGDVIDFKDVWEYRKVDNLIYLFARGNSEASVILNLDNIVCIRRWDNERYN